MILRWTTKNFFFFSLLFCWTGCNAASLLAKILIELKESNVLSRVSEMNKKKILCSFVFAIEWIWALIDSFIKINCSISTWILLKNFIAIDSVSNQHSYFLNIRKVAQLSIALSHRRWTLRSRVMRSWTLDFVRK